MTTGCDSEEVNGDPNKSIDHNILGVEACLEKAEKRMISEEVETRI